MQPTGGLIRKTGTMRLALHTDYALRVLMYLTGEQTRASVAVISEFFGISRDHVAKVAQRLTRCGYVRSVRGLGGGLELARDPTAISVGEVVADFEVDAHLLACVGGDDVGCRIQSGCRLRGVLAEAEKVQMEYLRGVSLAEVTRPGSSLAEIAG